MYKEKLSVRNIGGSRIENVEGFAGFINTAEMKIAAKSLIDKYAAKNTAENSGLQSEIELADREYNLAVASLKSLAHEANPESTRNHLKFYQSPTD